MLGPRWVEHACVAGRACAYPAALEGLGVDGAKLDPCPPRATAQGPQGVLLEEKLFRVLEVILP